MSANSTMSALSQDNTTEYVSYRGFIFGGKKVKVGQTFVISNLRNSEQDPIPLHYEYKRYYWSDEKLRQQRIRCGRLILVRLRNLLQVDGQSWMQLSLLQPIGYTNPFNALLFRKMVIMSGVPSSPLRYK
jgi:hypothetical protein